MLEKPKKQFYVYIYRLLDGTPIYVGKGYGERFKHHHRNCHATHLARKIRKIKEEEGYSLYPEILYAKDEAEALEFEKDLIAEYGRKDLGKGTLYNLTDGGDGASGLVVTEEQRRERSLRQKGAGTWCYGRVMPQEERDIRSEKMKGEKSVHWGKPRTEEVKQKLREANLGKKKSAEERERRKGLQAGEKNGMFGRKRTDEEKLKISLTKRERYPARPCPHCGKVGGGSVMIRYHFDNCKHKKGPDEPGQS